MSKNSFATGVASGRILVVDDDPVVCDLVYNILSARGYEVLEANNGYEALNILKRNVITVVIADVKMPRMDGATLLKKIKELFPSIPVVMITGYGSIDDAVDIMKQGASDYLPKPFSITSLQDIIQKSVCNNHDEKNYLKRIMTADPEMLRILEMVNVVAKTKRNTNVFIQGESGTGKELIARAIHESSSLCNGPFIAVNCAALPESLLESELFGHEQGAFTGAIARQVGKFELAHRGTLLLDEIVEMPASLQAKLLRALQEGEIDRIGGSIPIKVDVRIITTTNRNIKEEVEKGRFRADLFYRLYVVPITIPPLRDRKADIPLLVNHFLTLFSREIGKQSLSISEEALKALEAYNWPGNVRELENVVERAVMLCRGDALTTKDFFPDDLQVEPVNLLRGFIGISLHDMEKYLIMNTLEKVRGNRTHAAEILGITPRTIRNKIRKYKL